MRARRGRWDTVIYLALACLAGLALVVLLRPARSRPVPARVVAGDAVTTDEQLSGIVEQIDGSLACVRVDDEHTIWVSTDRLMSADAATASTPPPSSAPAARAPRPIDNASNTGALARLGAAMYAARHVVAIGWLIGVVACIPLAGTVEGVLTAGGYIPAGETQDVIDDMRDEYHLPIARLQVIVPGTARQTQQRIDENIRQLYRVPHVVNVAAPHESADHTLTRFEVHFDVADETVVDSLDELRATLVSAGFPEQKIQMAGTAAYYGDIGNQMKRDLTKAEAIGIPAALIVLLLVFGTVCAAALPLAVGIAAVIATLAIIHLLSLPLNLSIYVMNIASMLGLGLGIDYSLLGVSRFREELAAGATVRDATIATVTSAGRAAAISGVAVLLGMSALALIPLKIMESMAIAGVVVVGISVLATLTLLPALLALLGHNIERLPVRRIRQRTVTSTAWYRAVHLVMKRPGAAIVLSVSLLVLLAAPVRHAVLGVPHSDVLPTATPARVAALTLKKHFGTEVVAPALIELEGTKPALISSVRADLASLRGVERTQVVVRRTDLDRTLITVFPTEGKEGGPIAQDLTKRIRSKLEPHHQIRMTGQGSGETAFLDAIKEGMPRVLLLVFVATFLVLLVAFRSVALPIKAIVLDTLSIFASLGVVVAIFQLGHGAGAIGVTPLTYTEATIPIIQFCILFGLSMDYEVFMLARISELYQRGMSNAEATAQGVAGTAPLVTGAALILIALGLSFATTEIVLVRQIGLGMAVALALDATLVRMLLLPAAMRLMGPANWWLPTALLRRIPRISWAH